ncbi:16S rRNA (adenine(1518)-N(6)/adenine(1519)-N(6))-dimethyltransferase RsmA [Lentzea sp. NBC_00516]|uniref:16S rRNA (adenine(1518)-N(6)/adenine(1519)-N(6))- dimethyltransferase RsmA n=1 Tax=Lentzea sp. NBC_00516 TaxID=2903582 RepID=UPI002E801802|nr:16S rRNA (adenine(1518)-N(6)/adenine(1519)-N(6))-dimethyltransferase RsmA [Lentzea sp. NBC_00516]WUD29784.1 16S rRNA (adenine(1518)-N(6)/adenine(1519)-N(6))-dimethyltransferase RsmA [Lentzea sp. NBC_00516]
MLGPAEVRRLAEELGIRPTKKLGQNFVHDPNTVRKIVAAAGLTEDDVVLEVGPGLGSLTLALLPAAKQVVAVEIDPPLAQRLPQTVSEMDPDNAGKLHVVLKDAMKVTQEDLPVLPTAIVANLPYNVAVPVVLHLLAELPSLQKGLVMVQAEVADRMAAKPGNKIYGVPSVKLAWYAQSKKAGSIGKNVFWPAPNVDSGLVWFQRHEKPLSTVDRKKLFSIVDAAFAQRRKTLRAALKGWAGNPGNIDELLAEAGVDPQQRGEQLSVIDFIRIAEV